MKGLQGYREAEATSYEKMELPAGGYVLNILDVKEENYSWGDVIVLRFDIAEGKYERFFARQYESMSEEYKKWKGTYRLNVPAPKSTNEDDMKKYRKALGFFKSQIEAIEKSNNIKIDCESDWDINVLKNRRVGAIFNRKEWEMNGKSGFFTNCYKLTDVQTIREGNFKIPDDTLLKRDQSIAAPNNSSLDISDFVEILPGDSGNESVPF